MASATYLPGPSPEAQGKVSAPAIAIIVVSGLAIAWSLLNLLFQMLGVGAGMFGRGGGNERVAQLLGSTLGVVLTILGLIIYAVAIAGALKMKNLQSHAFAVTSAVLVMLPCSCCCFAGLPVGIWSLVVLMNDEVKSAFR